MISLRFQPQFGHPSDLVLVFVGGKPAGQLVLRHTGPDGYREIIAVDLFPAYQGRGLCKQVYEELAKTVRICAFRGQKVPQFGRIWDRLVSEGKAELVDGSHRMK